MKSKILSKRQNVVKTVRFQLARNFTHKKRLPLEEKEKSKIECKIIRKLKTLINKDFQR